jgi:hypothetical protein
MTWALVLWTVGMAAWLVIGAATAKNVALDCATDAAGVAAATLTQQECVAAAGLGSGAKAIVIGSLWMLGLVVLTAIWFMSRPLWRQGHGARLRRLRPDQLPWLYDQTTVGGNGKLNRAE